MIRTAPTDFGMGGDRSPPIGGGPKGGDKGPMGGDQRVIRDKFIRAILEGYKGLIISYIWVNQQHNGIYIYIYLNPYMFNKINNRTRAQDQDIRAPGVNFSK